MDMYVRAFHGPTDWGWVKQRLNVIRTEDTSGLVFIDRKENKTLAVMVLDNFTDNSVQAHIIIDTPFVIRHGVFHECADLVFNVMKKNIMYGWVPGNNKASLSVNKKMGWEEVARFPDAFKDGEDYILIKLTPDKCKDKLAKLVEVS